MTLSQLGLAKIKQSSILPIEQLTELNQIGSELQRVLEVKQQFRTDTEMRFSVLNDMKHPTIPSKYWQAIREQDGMFINLIYLSCDYEIVRGEILLLEADLENIVGNSIREKRNFLN